MKNLTPGDVIVHYDGIAGAVRGLSRVVAFGSVSSSQRRITTACAWFAGPHRSLAAFPPNKRNEQLQHQANGTGFYEVHVKPLVVADDPRLSGLLHVKYFGGYMCMNRHLLPAGVVDVLNAAAAN